MTGLLLNCRIFPQLHGQVERQSHPRNLHAQKGSTLLVGMMFLIILTLLGLSAATMSSVDERMARNSRDRNIALQAAEAALRDARKDIFVSRKLTGATGASAGCNTVGFEGLCLPATSGNAHVWDSYITDTARSIEYGGKTGLSTVQKFALAPTPGGVSAQPRYLIEALVDSYDGDSLNTNRPPKWLYRITALGYGTNSNTRILLQEVLRP